MRTSHVVRGARSGERTKARRCSRSRRAVAHGASTFFRVEALRSGRRRRGTRLGRDLGRVLDARRGTRNATFVFDQLLGSRATPERSQRVPSFVRSARGEARAVRPLARRSRRERGSRTRRRNRLLRPPRAGSAPRAGRRRRRLRRKHYLPGTRAVPRADDPVRVALGRARRNRRAAPVPAFVERCERACAELGAPAFAPHALFALHVLFELGDERSPNWRVPRVSARAIGGGGGG